MHLGGDRRQQTIARHRIENARLSKQHDENDRSQPRDGTDLTIGASHAHADGIDTDGDRIGDVELVIGNDPGKNERHRMASEPRMTVGMSRCGLLASCAAVDAASNPI
jgi:hypothetical protein